MRQFVESLKRLYSTGRLPLSKIQDYVGKRTISTAEYDYIVGANRE